jgi:hypothetical protein
LSPSPSRPDEDDEQPAEAARCDMCRGPAQGDHLEQVGNASHRRHEEVGERAEEPEGPTERTGGSRERGQQGDRRHGEGRQDRTVARRERNDRQDQGQRGRDDRHAP